MDVLQERQNTPQGHECIMEELVVPEKESPKAEYLRT